MDCLKKKCLFVQKKHQIFQIEHFGEYFVVVKMLLFFVKNPAFGFSYSNLLLIMNVNLAV